MIDLSYRDIYGNLQDLQATANSYVISKPGEYCFPLIMGNGIKNGKTNYLAFTNQKLSKKQADFYDYLDKEVVISPELIGGKSVSIISWDSSREFIKNLRVEEDYIKFIITNIPEDGANYVIGVKDSNNIIMWSWHLWLWKDELVVDDETKLLNVDLASVWIKGKLRSWYYQWGRKDPMYPGGKRNKPRMYRINNNKNSISHPLGYVEKETWNNTTQLGNWDPEKTIYDPCPPSYKVPDTETLEKFKKTCFTIDNGMVRSGKLCFYLNGFRGIGTRDLKTGKYMAGLISGLDNTGRYWANNLGYVMNIDHVVDCVSIKYNSWTNRLNAMSVRPQKI